MSTTDNLSVIREVYDEENGGFKWMLPSRSARRKKAKRKWLREQKLKQEREKLPSRSARRKKAKRKWLREQKLGKEKEKEKENEKLSSRSARRKKAKRKWMRELKLEKEKEKEKENENENESEKEKVLEKDDQLLPIKDKNDIIADVHQHSDEESEAEDDMVLEKDDQLLPIEDKNGIAAEVHQQSDEESEAEDDMVPVEIKPGHIRFQPRGKDQAVPENQFLVEGIVIAYRLIELSESWTPEISSIRVGKITQFDSKSNRLRLETVSEFPFDFRMKIDDLDDETTPAHYDPSPYQEDGSLEIDYASLTDVQIIKHGHSNLATVVDSNNALVTPTKATNSSSDALVTPTKATNSSSDALVTPTKATNNSTDALVTPTKATNNRTDALVTPTKATNNSTDEKHVGNQTPVGSSKPQKEGHTPAKENGEVNVWDEIFEAIKAKKARLSLGDG